MTLLDYATSYVKELFNELDDETFPEVEYDPGRPLNAQDDAESIEAVEKEGHRIVCVNEIIEDDEGNSFRVISVLGNGTFSYVFKCQLLSDPDTFVAMKIIKKLHQYYLTGIAEIQIHQLLEEAPDHPGKEHILQPISTFEEDGHVIIIMPLLSRSLFEGLSQSQSIIPLLTSIKGIMTQILEGLDFLHSNNVMHCDLKPENILFSNDDLSKIMIIDLGSASTNGSGEGQYIQSRFYRSPEVILGLPFNNKIDIWSAGCIAAELFLNFAIFACENESDAIHSMVALLEDIPDSMIAASKCWWKFYDITRDGYALKMDPTEVLLTKHSYASKYQEAGAMTLDQLILQHHALETDEEVAFCECFVSFVFYLLTFEPGQRPTAQEALSHPFITGGNLENWEEPNEDSGEPPAEVFLPSPLQTNDFFSLL